MDWFKHLFWLVGMLYRGLLSGDLVWAAESWFWIKTHLQYDYSTQSGFKNNRENLLTVAFGIVGTLWILLVVYIFIKILMKKVA